MIKYAIIRDDDISFFTSPNLLEEIYEGIFEKGIPVNFSIIPCIKVNVSIGKNIYSQLGLEYEPFIPPNYRGKSRSFVVYENHELIEFIQNLEEFTEVIQHGFSHTPNEFASINTNEVRAKIRHGKGIMEKAFGHEPKFFSAPNDKYSPISLMELKKHFFGVTYGAFTLKNMLSLRYGIRLPLKLMPPYVNALIRGNFFLIKDGFLVLGHKGFSINPFVDVDQLKRDFRRLFEGQKLILIMQHYWEYYFKENLGGVTDRINQELLDVFLELIQELKAQNTEFLTMSQFYKKFLS